jgi:hypothetical protein
MPLFHTYPYLAMCLAILAMAGTLVALSPGRRLSLVLSGLLAAPYGYASVFFVPEYWDPVRVFTHWKTGPEDLLFSFGMGVIVWYIALAGAGRPVALNIRARTVIRRFFYFTAAGIIVFSVMYLGRVGTMDATCITGIVIAMTVGWRRRALVRMAVAGAAGGAVIYAAILGISFRLWPDFVAQWNNYNLWGVSVFAMPLEEIVWAAVNGAVWPAYMTYCFDARPAEVSARAPSERRAQPMHNVKSGGHRV